MSQEHHLLTCLSPKRRLQMASHPAAIAVLPIGATAEKGDAWIRRAAEEILNQLREWTP